MAKLTIFVAPAVSEDEDSDITLQEISLDSALELDRNVEIPKETTGDQHAKGSFIIRSRVGTVTMLREI